MVADVMGRLEEHRSPVLLMTRVARHPEMAHTPAGLGGLASWFTYAGHPADSLRHAQRQRMTEGTTLRSVLEQGCGHVDDLAQSGDSQSCSQALVRRQISATGK